MVSESPKVYRFGSACNNAKTSGSLPKLLIVVFPPFISTFCSPYPIVVLSHFLVTQPNCYLFHWFCIISNALEWKATSTSCFPNAILPAALMLFSPLLHPFLWQFQQCCLSVCSDWSLGPLHSSAAKALNTSTLTMILWRQNLIILLGTQSQKASAATRKPLGNAAKYVYGFCQQPWLLLIPGACRCVLHGLPAHLS